MWAVSTLSYRLWPPTTTAATVTANYSRHRKNINYDYEDEDIENDRELQILKQQQIDNDREFEIMKQQQQQIGGLHVNVSATDNSDKISGSAVLLALQKASAQKTSKKMKKKSKNMKIGDANKRNPHDATVDYSDVKALCIKSDWKDRLDEIEKQLHELIHIS